MYLWGSAQPSHITGRKYGGGDESQKKLEGNPKNPIEQNRNKDNTVCKITIFHGPQ